MKVNVERDIDVERLLINLSEKSKCSSVGMAGYDESHISVRCDNGGYCEYEHEHMKEIPEPIIVGNKSIAYCPSCSADIHGKDMIARCPNCGQCLT